MPYRLAEKSAEKHNKAASQERDAGDLQRQRQADGARAGLPLFLRGSGAGNSGPGDGNLGGVQAGIVQRKEEEQALKVTDPALGQSPARRAIEGSDGQPLESETRASLEDHFGHDFSGVRIHKDQPAAAAAASLRAEAFTTGQQIFFGNGRFDSSSEKGRRLLAHEMTHVVQQSSGSATRVAPKRSDDLTVGAAEDPLEEKADLAAAAFIAGGPRMGSEDPQHPGLGAASGLIQRDSPPGANPDPDTPDPNKDADDAALTLRAEVTTGLGRSVSPPADIQSFVDELKSDIRADFVAKLVDTQVEDLISRAEQIRGIQGEVGKESFDYVTALQLLVRVLGLPPDAGVPHPSYGTSAFIHQVSGDISGFLTYHLYKPPAFYLGETAATLSSWLGLLLNELGDPKNFLRLELDGTLQHLVDLRMSFEAAKTPSEAAIFGSDIGDTARRVLLLNAALQQFNDDSYDPTSPLEERLAGIGPQVEQIRANAQHEKSTLAALGNAPQLLRPQEIVQDHPVVDSPDITSIAPEEAFPAASDRATEQMVGDLASRVQSRADAVEQLRNEVIPSSPSYDLLEFAAMYRRWFAFFSPAARDMDAFYINMRDLYRGIYSAYGMAGVEGGFGRALEMHLMSDYVAGALGEASGGFASNLSDADLQRRQSVSGTAEDSEYQFGELFAPGNDNLSASGEDSSRGAAISSGVAYSRQAFTQAQILADNGIPGALAAAQTGLIPTARNSVVFFHDQNAQNTWSYLLRTPVVASDLAEINVYEQKEMPPEIARYLLAQRQLRATLQHSHQPGFGDTATALGGVEEGRATATQRYLQGDRAAANPRVENNKATITSTAQKYGVERDSKTQKSTDPTVALIHDLEGYLNDFFAKQTEPALRITAVLTIAQLEHKIGDQFAHYFSADELKKAIVFVIAMVGIKTVLGRFGPVGEAISAALDKGLELMGVTPGAAMVALAAWLVDTGSVSTFREARVQAFFSWGVADDLGQLAQQYAIQGLVAGVDVARMRGNEPKNLAELADRFEPALQDPSVREAFLKEVDGKIADLREKGGGRDYSDPELDQLESLAAHLRNESVANVPDAASISLRPNAPVGGTRGVDVYRLGGSPVSRNEVLAQVDTVALASQPEAATHGLEQRQLLGEGVLTRTGTEHSGAYTLHAGDATVQVTVTTAPDAVFRTQAAAAHEGKGGPALFVLHRDPSGTITSASIVLHERVLKEDVAFLVRHEVNEISDIVSQNPKATEAAVEESVQASMFDEGSMADTATSHDKAAARELADLSQELQRIKELHSVDPQMVRDQQARIDRMVREMALDQGFRSGDPRTQVLREAGVTGEVMTDINNRGAGKRYSKNMATPVDAANIKGAEPTIVGRPGHATSKHGLTTAEQADVLNNAERVYSGVNDNGRQVDVYWKGNVLVITDGGIKERVITGYEEDRGRDYWVRNNLNMVRVR